MVAEAIIRKTCKELDIEVIDMSVSPDHIHLFISEPPKCYHGSVEHGWGEPRLIDYDVWMCWEGSTSIYAHADRNTLSETTIPPTTRTSFMT